MSSLNVDVLLHIFKNLEAKDITSTRLVCREWKDAADSDVLWELLVQRDYETTFSPTDSLPTAYDAYKYYYSMFLTNLTSVLAL